MSSRDVVCGTSAQPDSVEAADPSIRVAEQLLAEMGVPRRRRFTPSQLAQDLGGTTRSWQRACRLGEIGAVHIPGGWITTWQQLVTYLADRQNLVSRN